MGAAITGMLLIFFLTRVTELVLFLLVFYPFLALFIMSFILISGRFKKRNIYLVLIILIGGVVITFSLDLLFSYLVTIL